MRSGSVLLSLSACLSLLIIFGCASPPSPAPPGPAAAPPTVSAGRAPAPSTPPPAEAAWHTADFPLPNPPVDRLWAPHEPKSLQPLGFGKLPSENVVVLTHPSPSELKLETKLPQPPEQLPVYVVGTYAEIDSQTLARKIALPHPNCWFSGASAQLGCGEKEPVGPTQPIGSAQQAETRAKQLVQSLWTPDLTTHLVDALPDGDWRVIFEHAIEGVPIYSDRALLVVMNRSGQLVGLNERRRPAIARSLYPIRSVDAAWHSLEAGRYFAVHVASSGPADGTLIWGAGAPKAGEPFVINKVEIGYVVTHVYAPREIMQPYYIFRNSKRQALFVPAVADPHVTWPARYRDDPYQ